MAELANIPTEKEFLEQWVPRLPQAAHIKRKDAVAWREQVLAIEPERFAWHFERLFGIGGSEIGEIVAHRLGERCQFQTPREIALSKLMRRGLTPQDPILRRGVLMEPVIRRVFHEDFDVVPLPQERSRIERYRDADHPWMKANLDDFVLFEQSPAVIDYKAPAAQIHGDVPLLYVCQLHQYGHLYRKVFPDEGKTPPRMVNVRFRYESGCVQPFEVPWSDRIHALLLDAGDAFWGGVLRGEIPEWTPRETPALDLDPVERHQVEYLEDELLRALLLRDAAEKMRTEISGRLKGVLTRNGARLVRGLDADMAGLTMGVRQSADAERLARLLSEYPEVRERVFSPTKKWDADAMAERLRDLGEDLDRYRVWEPDPSKIIDVCGERGLEPAVSETVFFSASRKKAVAEQIEPLRMEAERIARQAMSRIGGDEDETDSPDGDGGAPEISVRTR